MYPSLETQAPVGQQKLVGAPGFQDSLEAMYLRRRAARPQDMLVGLFFESTQGHLVELLGAEAARVARTRVMGPQQPVGFLRYPASYLLRLVELGAQPGLGREGFHQRVAGFGRAAARHFLTSPVGKALLVLGRRDPHRLLVGSASGYKAVTTFMSHTYERVGERAARLRYQGDLLGVGWTQGVIEQALWEGCGQQARVHFEALDGMGTRHVAHVEW